MIKKEKNEVVYLIVVVILLLTGLVVGSAQTPTIKSDDLLKLRNLQYEQAKRILRMQDLKSEFDRLNSEQQKLTIDIENWIKEQGKAQNIDFTKQRFDLDQMKFVDIPKEK